MMHALVRFVGGSEQSICVSCISSRNVDDPDWEAFLEGIASGQYQQSSRWSTVKSRNPLLRALFPFGLMPFYPPRSPKNRIL